MDVKRIRRRWSTALGRLTGAVLVFGFCIASGSFAQVARREVIVLDLTKRWFDANTVVDAMLVKARECWLSTDPAFAGFAVVGKRPDADGKIVWLEFKPVPPARPGKPAKKPAQPVAADARILRLFAVPTFSGGYGIGYEQSEGIDIAPSVRRIFSDLERRGVIGC